MSTLEGMVKTPFGEVSKKTAVFAGVGLVGLFIIVYYRTKKSKAAAATAAAGANTGIDPATGYAYGSPEDAAALAAQSTYVTPTPSGSGGSGATQTGFTNNGQWAQAAEQFMQAEGLVNDPSALAAALGKYITGQPASDAETNLIDQAIAFQGMPPVAGPHGYPPSINRAPVSTPTQNPPPTGGTLPAPSGLRDTGLQWRDAIEYHWNAVPGASSYKINEDGTIRDVGNVTGVMRLGLVHNGSYFASIAAVDSAGVTGNWSGTLTSHTKN